MPRPTSCTLAGASLAALALLVAAPAYAEGGSATEPASATTPSAATVTAASATASPTSSPTSTIDPPPTTSGPTPSAPTKSAPTTSAPTTSTTTLPTTPPRTTDAPRITAEATTAATATSRAAAYVVKQLTGGDHVVGQYGPDAGQTSDVALGLIAAGNPNAAAVVRWLRANGAGYVHGDPTTGERADANYAGPTGKLAVVAQAAGADATSFGGIDLLGELRLLMATTGPDAGRFRDDSTYGDYSNPLGQAFDVLALARAGGAPDAAVAFLAKAQCADGGFPDAFGGRTCTSSPDATGLVLDALVAADADCPASRALGWLTTHQRANGSFGSNAVNPAAPEVANVNSTAYASLGLVAAGTSTTAVRRYLTSVQNTDGGLPTVPSSSKASNLLATAQALNALARTSFSTLGAGGLRPSAVTCASSTSTPTTSTSPTTTTSSTTITSSTTTTTSSTSSSSSTEPVVSGTTSSTSSSTPVVASGDLPRTGADLLTPVATGLLLLVAGSTLLLASRRTGRRPGRRA